MKKNTFHSSALSRRCQDDILECLRKAQGARTIPGEQLSSVIAAQFYTRTNLNLIYRSRLAGATLIYGLASDRIDMFKFDNTLQWITGGAQNFAICQKLTARTTTIRTVQRRDR